MHSLQKVKKIEQEIASFMEVLADYHTRAKQELMTHNDWQKRYDERHNNKHEPAKDISIDGTKQAAALKNTYKVLKYKLDKLVL